MLVRAFRRPIFAFALRVSGVELFGFVTVVGRVVDAQLRARITRGEVMKNG